VVQLESHDEGHSFKVRRVLPMSPVFNTSVLVRSTPVGLADGGWWLPVYFEIGHKYPMLVSFDANGDPQNLTRIGARTRSLQPTLVPVSPTEVRAWMRDARKDNSVVQQAVSHDGGATWEDLGPTNIRNLGTSLAVLRLHSGSLLMLGNQGTNRKTARSTLSLSISSDGQTWKPLTDIIAGQPGDEFSYPAMFQVGDELHITYTHQRRAIAHHRMKIYDGRSRNELARTRPANHLRPHRLGPDRGRDAAVGVADAAAESFPHLANRTKAIVIATVAVVMVLPGELRRRTG
jgi:predicted neuraminidase